ncbi:hypothetical protein NDU88_000269 [Pleurodeles waltl]|uniref:Uncharacterized protein n=1 Tax=Pleurodeles waltl TaxID=8319 RepID=A0AAV7KTN6_PLEWA|nr:hypothetical protein NDU88_000269 [Pleurodeles waltl]
METRACGDRKGGPPPPKPPPNAPSEERTGSEEREGTHTTDPKATGMIELHTPSPCFQAPQSRNEEEEHSASRNPDPDGDTRTSCKSCQTPEVVVEAQVHGYVFAVRFLLAAVLKGLLPAGHGSLKPRGTKKTTGAPPSRQTGEPGCGLQPPEPRSGVKGSEGPLQQALRCKARRHDGSAPPGDAAPGCGLRRVLAPDVSRGAGSTAKRPQARPRTPSSASGSNGARQPRTGSAWGAAACADPEAQWGDRLRQSRHKPRHAVRSVAPVPGGWMGNLTP